MRRFLKHRSLQAGRSSRTIPRLDGNISGRDFKVNQSYSHLLADRGDGCGERYPTDKTVLSDCAGNSASCVLHSEFLS